MLTQVDCRLGLIPLKSLGQGCSDPTHAARLVRLVVIAFVGHRFFCQLRRYKRVKPVSLSKYLLDISLVAARASCGRSSLSTLPLIFTLKAVHSPVPLRRIPLKYTGCRQDAQDYETEYPAKYYRFHFLPPKNAGIHPRTCSTTSKLGFCDVDVAAPATRVNDLTDQYVESKIYFLLRISIKPEAC